MLAAQKTLLLLCVGVSLAHDSISPEQFNNIERRLTATEETLKELKRENEALRSYTKALGEKLESIQAENEGVSVPGPPGKSGPTGSAGKKGERGPSSPQGSLGWESISDSLKSEMHQLNAKIAMIEKVVSFNTFRKVGQKYYITDGVEATFDTGMKYCKDAGGTIVLPRTASENQALLKVAVASGLGSKKSFIRITDRETEGRFVDTEGKQLTFTNWHPPQPDDYKGLQDCGSIANSGFWDDIGCNGLHPIICEIEIR